MRRSILWLVLTGLFAVAPAAAQERMRAHFIEVGQANATLLEFPCGAVLIDAGSQDEAQETHLLNYLENFFGQRPDLNRTLDLVIITHNHIDHTRSLREVVAAFAVENFVDSGHSSGPGTGAPNWVRRTAEEQEIGTEQIADPDVARREARGLTSAAIDPVACEGIDPVIRVLSGRRDVNPGWPAREFNDKNNHSIVVRIDYGASSFLFTGDLEEPAIELLLERYAGTGMLDADVYEVGHHGSHNGTTDALLRAMTPSIAVISVGQWSFGRGLADQYTTYAYGHPRRVVLEALSTHLSRDRATARSVRVGEDVRSFRSMRVTKAIYATAWDGDIVVSTDGDGRFRVDGSR